MMKSMIRFFLSLAIVSGIIIGGYYSYVTFLKKNSRAETNDILLNELEKTMDLPEGNPAVATVLNGAKLREQGDFYREAKDGDKILMWERKAILYRPSTHKVINFGIIVQN